MNCTQLNKIELEEVLASLGHLPIRKNAKEAWYINPFYIETQASFKIDLNKNLWYLHSEGIGGNVTDFLVRYLNISIPEALAWARDRNFVFSFQPQKNEPTQNYSITEIKALYSYPLKNYLKERGLSKTIWKYVNEVKFTINQKKYFAIGFQNDSGGWELRNTFYKGSLKKKDITTYLNEKSDSIRVFEGFMDFLSFKEMYPEEQCAYIILNSVSMVEKARTVIKDYKNIYLYLDNDSTGKKITKKIASDFSNVIDCSEVYADYKDLNEFLIANSNVIIHRDVPLCPHGNLAFTPDGRKRNTVKRR